MKKFRNIHKKTLLTTKKMIAENKQVVTKNHKKNPSPLARLKDFSVAEMGYVYLFFPVGNLISEATKRQFLHLFCHDEKIKPENILLLSEGKSKDRYKNTNSSKQMNYGLKWKKILRSRVSSRKISIMLFRRPTTCMKNNSYIFINHIVVNNYIISQKWAKCEYFAEKFLLNPYENKGGQSND